jgi:hypothetical protein
MVAIKRAIEPYEKKKAKDRQLSGKPSVKFTEGGEALDKIAGFVGLGRTTLQKAKERELAGKPLGKFPKGRAAEQVAGFVGISRPTLQKAEEIVTAAEQEPEKYWYR